MDSVISSEDSNSPDVKAHRKAWVQLTTEVFGNGLFSDVTIVVEGKEIKAHKLCLLSEYKNFVWILFVNMYLIGTRLFEV